MQFALNDDQIAIRDMASAFAAENIAPHALKWDEEKFFPVDVMRETLRRMPDIARALGRLSAGRGSPRDLGSLRDGLSHAWTLGEQLAQTPDPPALLTALAPDLSGHGALIDLLTRALVPEPPVDAANGGYIAAGYDASLDALRETGGSGRRDIAALEAKMLLGFGAGVDQVATDIPVPDDVTGAGQRQRAALDVVDDALGADAGEGVLHHREADQHDDQLEAAEQRRRDEVVGENAGDGEAGGEHPDRQRESPPTAL